jgi:exonuclease III
MSLNVAGINRPQKFSSLLRGAHRRGIDVLLLQEHNIRGRRKAAAAAFRARAAGYHMYMAQRGENALSGRGGTAVLIRRDSETVSVNDNVRCSGGLDGGVCAVPVSIGDVKTRVVSVYAPSDARQRDVFFRHMKRDKWIHKHDVVGGDFNCVPDVTLDTCKIADGAQYANRGGQLCESIMADAGLTDVYRLFYGKTARGYTRQGDSVYTRLDRIYAKKHNSAWRFTSVTHDHTQNSDHSAVIVSILTITALWSQFWRPHATRSHTRSASTRQ